MAERSGGVQHVVPDLAGVAVAAVHWQAADDDPGADPDPAHQEDDVVAVAGVAALVLSQDGEVGVVADVDRNVAGEPFLEHGAELDASPAEVGCEPDQPVTLPDGARDRHADARHA